MLKGRMRYVAAVLALVFVVLLLANRHESAPARAEQSAPVGASQALRSMAPGLSWGPSGIWLGERAVKRTAEGYLIDLNCFVEHAGFGGHHRTCARTCARRGLPLGLIDRSGRIYVISGPGHVPTAEVNEPLLDYVETTVQVTGYFFEHQDVKLLAVEKVERANAQLPLEALQSIYRGPSQ